MGGRYRHVLVPGTGVFVLGPGPRCTGLKPRVWYSGPVLQFGRHVAVAQVEQPGSWEHNPKEQREGGREGGWQHLPSPWGCHPLNV